MLKNDLFISHLCGPPHLNALSSRLRLARLKLMGRRLEKNGGGSQFPRSQRSLLSSCWKVRGAEDGSAVLKSHLRAWPLRARLRRPRAPRCRHRGWCIGFWLRQTKPNRCRRKKLLQFILEWVDLLINLKKNAIKDNKTTSFCQLSEVITLNMLPSVFLSVSCIRAPHGLLHAPLLLSWIIATGAHVGANRRKQRRWNESLIDLRIENICPEPQGGSHDFWKVGKLLQSLSCFCVTFTFLRSNLFKVFVCI